MLEIKQRRMQPTEKHLHSHRFILYKKTLVNVVKSLQRLPSSTKRIQRQNESENVYFEAKTKPTHSNSDYQHGNNFSNQERKKSHHLHDPFKLNNNTQRHKNHSHKKHRQMFLFKHEHNRQKDTGSPVAPGLRKYHSDPQHQKVVIQKLREQNNFYKYKCFESEQKINKLEQKFHEQRKSFYAEKEQYEQKIKKLSNDNQSSEKKYLSLQFKRTVQGRSGLLGNGKKNLHRLQVCNQEEEVLNQGKPVVVGHREQRKILG